MATSTSIANCVRCTKRNTTAKCSGCMQDFCLNHLIEHHQQIERDFDELANEQNILRQSLSEQNNNLKEHALFKQIIQWEDESIRRIQQIADEQKTLLLKCLNRYFDDLGSRLNQVTRQCTVIRQENDFNEIILMKLQTQLKELAQDLDNPSTIVISEEKDKITVSDISSKCLRIKITFSIIYIFVYLAQVNMKWSRNGITVAGGNGYGEQLNQCATAWGICIDNTERTIYIADTSNHRIVEWKNEGINGRIVAGGNGRGNQNNQLEFPEKVIRDYITNSLIISDRCNRRIVRWSCRNDSVTQGETIISNVSCWGLAMDQEGYLYGADIEKHEIRRWKLGEDNCGVGVAGGNDVGNHLNQFNEPRYVFVDREQAVYVSDNKNHRVMKWTKGAHQGVIVAGGNGPGERLCQLSNPHGIFVDQLGTVYVADSANHRVVRWLAHATEGSLVVGEGGRGHLENQLNCPIDLTFDDENNLYVVDRDNRRVQKFFISFPQ